MHRVSGPTERGVWLPWPTIAAQRLRTRMTMKGVATEDAAAVILYG